MSPFEKLTGRKTGGQTQPPQPTRMYRPSPTGNLQIDTAFRQIIDNQQGFGKRQELTLSDADR